MPLQPQNIFKTNLQSLSYCLCTYLIDSLWTFNFFLNSPLYTTALPRDTDELAAALRLGTGGIVGLAVLTTAITC